MADPVNLGETSKPWLSVVMPVHEGADYLGAALQSLADQPDTGIKVIIIDSSAGEECRNIAEGFKGRLAVDYLYRPEVKSWQSKTNMAVMIARTPYVAMLHQDDIWLPGRVETMRKAIDSHPDATMYLSSSHFIDAKGKSLGPWRCPLNDKAIWFGDEMIERLLVQNFIAIPAPIIRRSDWQTVGGLDETLWYTADWDLYLKLSGLGDFVNVSTPTVAFRVHAQSLTVQGSKDIVGFERQLKLVIDRHGKRISSRLRKRSLKLAKVSIAVNVALAAAATGDRSRAVIALKQMIMLSPRQLRDYFHFSRIVERLKPRCYALLWRSVS